ncbi:MAG: peptidyl-prolyl cis-trans isomerase D [Arenicella sp.]|jgi:peptidyl-prolyl cis-trans isomerase D
MLTEIRDRSSGWFAWVIAALIIIPMAFWGVQEYASTEANPSLVEVGDQKITQSQYQAQLSNEQQRIRQILGDQADSNIFASDDFKQRILQQMINRAVIEQLAVNQNYQIGDAQLVASIKESELFQVEGKFDTAAYERYVISSPFTKTRYENSLREDRRLQQVTTGYEESALVLADEMRALLDIQTEKRSFDVITLKPEAYAQEIQISDAAIAEYYAENQDSFLNEEQLSLSYLELNIDQISETIEVDEDELLAIYEQNLESYISEEKRATRHILLSTNNGENEAVQLAKAQSLIAELADGGDFAELATANSQDPGSAVKGGSLGLVERGQMVAEFEKATFALAQNQISEPIKSQFGYHIIQVTAVNLPEQQSFEDVKFDLMSEERERLAEELLLEKVDQLRDLAFEQPDNLDQAAEELGLTILTTELFDRNTGAGIASSSLVRDAAFSEEILNDEINSQPIEATPGQYLVIRKAQHQAAEPKALAEVKDQISQNLTNQAAIATAETQGGEMLVRAESDWDSLAGDESITITKHTVALIDNNQLIAPEVVRKAASMNLLGGRPTIGSVVSANGDFNIVRLSSVEAGDVNTVSQQIKDSTRRVVAQRNGQSLLSTYLKSLSSTMAPEINQELL